MVVYSFAAHVLLPWRVVSALAASGTLVAAQVALWKGRPPSASLLLLACANLLGLMAFLWVERMQRRAFLETRQSLEAKLVVEEESQVSAHFPTVLFLYPFMRDGVCRGVQVG
ncbi:hypothetical protein HPB50_006207 [Hyalomma asiaticum]|uniref:Uncharacterized protein n=1 Tax=Hyalomma asiaticum TaxID=266040 RepID=A0ACB7SN73_HYAAI|nr:hypothetical protein HPB50_006207 [Hyalomma asiaticum]